MSILGAAACVLAVMAGVGFGFNLRSWTAGLQTAANPVIVCAAYLALALIGSAGVILCLRLV